MTKVRRRKQPVTEAHHSPKSLFGRDLIRRFHLLLKRRQALLAGSNSASHELVDIEKEIDTLGGLQGYQRMSARGQSDERGGGSHKVFITWMLREGVKEKRKCNKLRLLEVGALRHDNYTSHSDWIECTPIDLQSRHPLIQEQDFLEMDKQVHCGQWDALSLSLVLNFVPSPYDRGKMLSLAHDFLREGGYLFLALPLPCLTNSRYLDFERLKHIMSVLGFTMGKERWKQGGKMAYWLFQKDGSSKFLDGTELSRQHFTKKAVIRDGGSRNNFAILL